MKVRLEWLLRDSALPKHTREFMATRAATQDLSSLHSFYSEGIVYTVQCWSWILRIKEFRSHKNDNSYKATKQRITTYSLKGGCDNH